MDDNTIICRCEELSLADIRGKIKEGYTSMEELKRLTRCSMGPCQGRTCRDMVLREIAKAEGKDVGEVSITTFRPPVKPVKLKSMLGVDQND